MSKIIIGVFVVTLLSPSVVQPQKPISVRYEVPRATADGWKTAEADLFGLDSTKLAALTQSIRSWPELGVHAVLIERRGRLIYEEYFDGFDERWGEPN